MIFSGWNASVLGTNRLAFGKDPDSFVDPGSMFMILYLVDRRLDIGPI